MPIRVVAIEDDPQYRGSLDLLFRQSEDFALVDSFGSPAAALDCLAAAARGGQSAPWDLALMDLDLPGLTGIECTRRLKALYPGMAVVVLTVFEERATILEAICAGADGYLLKQTPADRLLLQLRAITDGGSPLSAGVARTVLDLVRRFGPPRSGDAPDAPRLALTEREQEVLACLVQGMPYKRVARHLDISIDTVRSHVRAIYSKLQVHSVAAAVSRALREGLT